jgi:hypothetical protein
VPLRDSIVTLSPLISMRSGAGAVTTISSWSGRT